MARVQTQSTMSALTTDTTSRNLPIVSAEPASKSPSKAVNHLKHKHRAGPSPRRVRKIRSEPMASLAFDEIGLLLGEDDESCPSPIVRTSQDQIDLHQALRSRLPPFKKSRKWSRVYMAKGTTPTAKTTRPLPKRRDTLDHDAACLPQYADDITADNRSDTESDRAGPCSLAPIIGWQAFKQHRLLKRHSMPIKPAKTTGLRSPKRMISTRSLRAGFSLSPRRAALPRTAQNRGKSRDADQDDIFNSPTYRKQPGTIDDSLSMGNFHLREESEDDVAGLTASPIPSLHDPEKDKRFSRECINILSGLDFGDEWRLSTFGPQLSVSPKSSGEFHAKDSKTPFDKSCPTPGIAVTAATPQSIREPPEPPVRTSSKRLGVPAMARQLQFTKPAVSHTAKIVHNMHLGPPAHDADDEDDDDFVPLLGPLNRRESAKATNSRHRKRRSINDLKSARSVDTLTQIEAQVVEPSLNTVSHHLQPNANSFTSPSSTNIQTPSGQPPERPLPDLPKYDVSVGKRPSRNNSQRSIKTGRVSIGPEDHLGISSIHTLISISSHKGLGVKTTCSAIVEDKLFQDVASADRLNSSQHVSDRRLESANNQKHVTLPDDENSDAMLMIKGISNERNSRIQALKRRHIATWSESQNRPTALNCNSENVGRIEVSDNNARPFCTNELDQFPCVPKFSENQSSATMDAQPVQEPDRNLSKKNSRSCGKLDGKGSSGSPNQPHLSREKSKRTPKAKQTLSHSHIMIVVDTNPHTASFRAGAISPCPSMASLRSRPTSPHDVSNRNIPKSRPSSPSNALHAPQASLENIVEMIEVAQPPTVELTGKASSRRSLRSQMSMAGSSAIYAGRQTPDHISGVLPRSRGGMAACHYHMLDSTDSEIESGDPISAVLNQATIPRSYSAHRRKETPFTAMLKHEVRKADQELENLKKYEKRIEHLQTHLEQTLRIWGRMSQSGKKRYLESTLGKVDSRRESRNVGDDRHMSIAASSIYSQPSVVAPVTSDRKSFDTILTISQQDSNDPRRISSTSTMTYAGTVTDTDISIEGQIDDSYKRASGGSITDPCDCEFSSSREVGNNGDRHSKFDCQKIGVAISPCVPREFRQSHLHWPGARNSSASFRRCKRLSPPIVSQDQFALLQNRAMIVPWEQHDHVKVDQFDDLNPERDSHPHRLSLDHKIKGTEQMDALLVM